MHKKNLIKEIKPMDWLIMALAIYLMGFRIDYGALNTIDIIYLVTFTLWLVMFVIRLYLLSKK